MQDAPVVLSWAICLVAFALVPFTFLAYNRRLLRSISPFKSKLAVDFLGFVLLLGFLWLGHLLRGRLEEYLRHRMAHYDLKTLAVVGGVTFLCLFLLYRRKALKET